MGYEGLLSSVILQVMAFASCQFQCPSPSGFYPDTVYCDKYYECRGGKPIERFCEDGYVFRIISPLYSRCDYPFNVDCRNREERRPAQPSPYCPRRFGLFRDPNPGNCSYFWQCVNGRATSHRCQDGLAFHPRKGNCHWPHAVPGCEQTLEVHQGFKCPQKTPTVLQAFGLAPRYPHPNDCNKFLICLYGRIPRMMACPRGKVYNTVNMQCDKPENVPECIFYYKERSTGSKQQNAIR
ncbi:protein obstructor-E-like [Tachypleus tridentatus]|uniref:protein obstructor-E-like n=1 Tax=Tachypleus tridentatus TaxID=6853 RepID=UPI003FD0804C